MDRLFIFNFSTLKEIPKPTSGVLAALGLLLVVRLGLFLSQDILMFSPQDEQRYYAFRNDVRFIDDGRPHPKALILGTSRFTALNKEYIARPRGFSDDEVLNYATPGMTFWHVKRFLEHYPEITENLDLIVLDMLPFQLSQGEIFSHEAPYYIGESSMGDALSTGAMHSIFLKGVDSLWPAWSERRRVPEWIATANNAFVSADERRHAFLNYQQPFRAIQKRQQAIGMEAIKTYSSERISPVQLRALHAIPELLPENTKVLLLWLPVNEVYRNELNGLGQAGKSYREFKKSVMEIDHPQAQLVWVEDLEPIGLVSSEFLDEVHYGESGMTKVGIFLEGIIENL